MNIGRGVAAALAQGLFFGQPVRRQRAGSETHRVMPDEPEAIYLPAEIIATCGAIAFGANLLVPRATACAGDSDLGAAAAMQAGGGCRGGHLFDYNRAVRDDAEFPQQP